MTVWADAEERYRRAQERAKLAENQRIEAGRPFTLTQSNGTRGRDPAYTALIEAEKHVDRLRRALATKNP